MESTATEAFFGRGGAARRALGAVLSNRKAAAGALILGLFTVAALLGPPLLRSDPGAFIAAPHQPPSAEHLFGTTGQGQDVLAQTVVGARTSLFIGFATGLAVLGLGALIGMTAGFFGGFVDDALSLLINVFLIIPGLPLAVVIAAYLPTGPLTVMIILIITGWAWPARVLRSQVLSVRTKDFVSAAIVSGEGSMRVILREILPNMTSLLMSCFINATLYAISAQIGLEFLGLGDLSRVTWGTNLYWASNNAALLTGAWWTIVPTGVSVALVGFALVLINFAIDEITSPRLRAERAWSALPGARGAAAIRSTPVLRRHG